jgi:hypothetical protein
MTSSCGKNSAIWAGVGGAIVSGAGGVLKGKIPVGVFSHCGQSAPGASVGSTARHWRHIRKVSMINSSFLYRGDTGRKVTEMWLGLPQISKSPLNAARSLLVTSTSTSLLITSELAGTLRVRKTFPPMVLPAPTTVSPPRIVAPG